MQRLPRYWQRTVKTGIIPASIGASAQAAWYNSRYLRKKSIFNRTTVHASCSMRASLPPNHETQSEIILLPTRLLDLHKIALFPTLTWCRTWLVACSAHLERKTNVEQQRFSGFTIAR
jgi:hypothetical protein